MISDFSNELYYWGPLLVLVWVISWLCRARVLDFAFIVILVLSQYFLHAVISFGVLHPIGIFCTAFLGLFVLVARAPERDSVRAISVRASRTARSNDDRWFRICRAYLVVYFTARLLTYPFFSGELLLDERLLAQQENRLLFTLGLATQPALAGCMFVWMSNPARLRAFDKLVIAIVAFGLFGAGSKGAIAPLVLTYLGVASYLNKNALANKTVTLAIVAAALTTAYALGQFFPDLAYADIASLVQYRIVANTDSLEYIQANGVDPRTYPYAGLGALFPLITKRLGYEFEFPPGVWMHGMRFGDWSGFGPNAGIVLDYFGNLSWFGLVAAILIGLYVRKSGRHFGVIHCSFLAMAPALVVDVGIFDINLMIWGGLGLMLIALQRFRFGRIRLSVRLRRARLHARPAALGPSARG
jgi:hypothetical protein